MDLSVIALLQLVALVYGVYVIAQARPVFVGARVDRLVLVSADQLSDAHLAKGARPLFRQRSWTGPVRVAAVPPVGAAAGDLALQVLRDGIDIDRRPAYYEPWDQGIGKVLARATPLAQIHTDMPAQRAQVHALQQRFAGHALLALPLQSGSRDDTVIIDSASRRSVAVLPINPWQTAAVTQRTARQNPPSPG